MLEKAGEAFASINRCLSGLYAENVFIAPDRAIQLAELGLKFLRRLGWLAKEAGKLEKALWILTPKAHALHHMFLEDMLLPARRGVHPMNPLATSVQMDEDCVGRHNQTIRRTDPRLCSKRCIERALEAGYDEYVKAGYLRPQS